MCNSTINTDHSDKTSAVIYTRISAGVEECSCFSSFYNYDPC